MKTEILICVTCQPNDISRDAPRVGAKLYEAVNELANGDFLVEKRYIDLLVQNWMPKKTDGQAAKDSNIIELSAKDIEARRINIFGRKPSI